MKLDRDPFFEQMAIAIKRGQVAQYFFADNLEGYFEGHTHRYAQGAGYILKRRALYRDFLSWSGERLNDREAAEGATLFPYGVRHQHGPSWWDEFMLLRKRKAVALRVYSRRPQSLALAPLLALRREHVVVYPGDGAMLISNPERSLHIAVSSSQPFKHDGSTDRDGLFAPIFRTLQDETEFTLYLAFGRDAERALGQARRLREEDGVRHHKQAIFDLLTRSTLFTSNPDYNRALAWAKLSSLFMVTEEFGKGIWAGLPWFKDNWGRDTFIALPGTLLAAGLYDDAKEVIRNFAKWQMTDPKSEVFGRVPNRVASPTDIIYNTTDGTPWLIREIGEYLHYTGDLPFAEEIFPMVKLAIEGALKNHVDAKGFLTHDDADTWMDARIEGKLPWSARGNRANDIQALWHCALLVAARLAELKKQKALAKKWRDLAAKLKKNFAPLFWDAKKKQLADRVRADNSRDLKPRPNQLMVLTIPLDDEGLLDEKTGERVLENAVGELLFPHGICSLSPAHPYFHPHHHRDEQWHFDAPYHNGNIWGWNAGFAITALCRHGQPELAWSLAANLTDQILKLGCRGGMSELVEALPDAKGRLVLSGTWQQAWSTSEFVRNGYQDFSGFQPRLLDGLLRLAPNVPAAWSNFTATYPFGRDGRLHVNFTRQHGKEVFLIQLEGPTTPLDVELVHTTVSQRFTIRQAVKHGDTLMIVMDDSTATVGLNGQWAGKPVKAAKTPQPKPLTFAKIPAKAKFKTLAEPHYLQKIIEAGQFE
ncbi:MAG TPA: amylo-alpha-1,6-glucosidase [Kiritimatiellia bacterium]|nr:amylo-alpha-1,6-glucosidase [Kiritimatiellia bacterium]